MTTLGVLVAVLLLLPAEGAVAATADLTMRDGPAPGTTFGLVTYAAKVGERNRLEITSDDRGRMVFRDRVEVVARGDCEQLTRHAAACPRTETGERVYLGDRADRVRASFGRFGHTQIFGGRGGDTLEGARGGNWFVGGRGGDLLRGGPDRDVLTGGPGRDRVLGRGGADALVDGERDREAAPDVFLGGPSRDTHGSDQGDTVGYDLRKRGIRIDLGRRPAARTSTEDTLRGLENVNGGSGNDRLNGDARDNTLYGGPGDDVIAARGGEDIPTGGPGEDRVDGGGGNDVVWGDGDNDLLIGGPGRDSVISAEEAEPKRGDRVRCGKGQDSVRSEHRDTLARSCEEAFSSGLNTRVQPDIDADSADFTLECSGAIPGGCRGSLVLADAADGHRYGSAHYEIDTRELKVIAVELSDAGARALAAGVMAKVELVPDEPRDPFLEAQGPGGYRTFIRREWRGRRYP